MVAVVPAGAARARSRRVLRALGAALHAAIGEVTDTGELRAFVDGDAVGEIPAALLTDECPRYEVERGSPSSGVRLPCDPINLEPEALDLRAVRPPRQLADRAAPGPRRRRAAAAALDGAGSRCRSTGRRSASATRARPGGQAVLEAARNVACAGGEPLALTDCLNFGNPEKPEIGWELAEAIEGIAETAEALGIPVVSGNVSLYNETDGRAIPPTPVVGCVGLVAGRARGPAGLAAGRRASGSPRATTSS